MTLPRGRGGISHSCRPLQDVPKGGGRCLGPVQEKQEGVSDLLHAGGLSSGCNGPCWPESKE